MKYLLIAFLTIMSSAAYAQQASNMGAGKQLSTVASNASHVYDDPETPAHFSHGKDSLDRFIAGNMRLAHVENGVGTTGKAIVVFIVEKDGSIGPAEILSISGDKDFDTEAVRIAKLMPKWVPAKEKGELVRSSNMLTFAYKLR